LCDIWQPPAHVPRSGLGVIYLHAGGWQNFDKDIGTRPFFRYLAAQGHVIIDVAYRMCGETDLLGMVGDVKRAIAWLKAHAAQYQVDLARVVLIGASAGGQLALTAAYAPNDPQLDPADLRGVDTSVRGVVSFYGPTDMLRFSEGTAHPDWPLFVRLGRKVGIVHKGQYLMWSDVECRLFGGPASSTPETVRLLSPIGHVGPNCPPTLLIHGAHDRVVPVERSRDLCAALRGQGVPVVYLELPLVDHAFDLPLLRVSPPAQAALYDIERFLALMAGSW
jgi:acetyl esterase/lipase